MTLSEQLLEIFTNSQNVETLEKKVIDRKFFWNFAFGAKRKRIAKEVLEQFISSLLSREKNLTPQDKKQILIHGFLTLFLKERLSGFQWGLKNGWRDNFIFLWKRYEKL